MMNDSTAETTTTPTATATQAPTPATRSSLPSSSTRPTTRSSLRSSSSATTSTPRSWQRPRWQARWQSRARHTIALTQHAAHTAVRIVACPFIVMGSLLGLFLFLLFFCLPLAIFFVGLICLYYCCTENPIPPRVLLRALWESNDGEMGGGPHPQYTMEEIQSHLFKRIVQDIGTSSLHHHHPPAHAENVRNNHLHPGPVYVQTTDNVYYTFSEPLHLDEELAVMELMLEAIREDSLAVDDDDDDDDDDDGDDDDDDDDENDDDDDKQEEGRGQLEPDGHKPDDSQVVVVNHDDVLFVQRLVDDEFYQYFMAEHDGVDGDDHDEDYDDNRDEEGMVKLEHGEQDEADDDDDDDDGDNDDHGDDHMPELIDPSDESPEVELAHHDDPSIPVNDEDSSATPPEPPHPIFDEEASWSAKERGTTCDICLGEYQVGDIVAWSRNPECDHAYHAACISDWCLRRATCPTCRHDYILDTTKQPPSVPPEGNAADENV